MEGKIHEHFWELTKEMQMQWMVHMVETVPPLRPRKRTSVKKEIKCTGTFLLEKKIKKRYKFARGCF